MAEKLDLTVEQKSLYFPGAKTPVICEVPEMQFLMIDGKGSPNTSQQYKDAVSALYALSYTLKFAVKKQNGVDYRVMPLEGLWWGTPQGQLIFDETDKEKWSWISLIRQPDFITPEMVEAARLEAFKKKGVEAINQVRLESFEEGLVVQIMHIGPFSAEPPTVERMHAFAFEQGYQLRGKHHEVYLSDPNRAAPEKLKTVLRHPIEKAA